jgi:hypothetical protein
LIDAKSKWEFKRNLMPQVLLSREFQSFPNQALVSLIKRSNKAVPQTAGKTAGKTAGIKLRLRWIIPCDIPFHTVKYRSKPP